MKNNQEKLQELIEEAKQMQRTILESVRIQIAVLDNEKKIIKCGFFIKKKLEKVKEIHKALLKLEEDMMKIKFLKDGYHIEEDENIERYAYNLWSDNVMWGGNISKIIINQLLIFKTFLEDIAAEED